MPRTRNLLAAPAVLALAIGLAACGGSAKGKQADATLDTPPLTRTDTQPTTATAPIATTPTVTLTVPTTTTSTPATPQTTAPQQTRTSTVPSNTQPGESTPPQTSAPGGAPVGCAGAVGGFVKNVQASGTDCDTARGVASSWFDRIHSGADPSSSVSAGGYSCAGDMEGERASVTCSGNGGSEVTFTASP